MSASVIYSWQQAREYIDKLKAQNPSTKIVTTNGCFDIIHAGHCRYLEQSKALGDCLIVGINSDQSVKKIKGPERPINNETSRAIVLNALKAVNLVCVFDEDTPIEWLKTIRPDIHTKGGDYIPDQLPEFSEIKKFGGKVVCLPFVEGYSTTSVIQKIKR